MGLLSGRINLLELKEITKIYPKSRVALDGKRSCGKFLVSQKATFIIPSLESQVLILR